jgi:hypothetical protein
MSGDTERFLLPDGQISSSADFAAVQGLSSCAFYFSHARLQGASCARHSLRPLLSRRERTMHRSGASCRENADACLHREEHSCPPKPAFGRRRMRRSNPAFLLRPDGSLCGARHRARIRTARWLAMTTGCEAGARPCPQPLNASQHSDTTFQLAGTTWYSKCRLANPA